MVFAEVFERAQFDDFALSGAYIDYRELARLMKRLKQANDPATPAQLLDECRSQIQRTLKWFVAKRDELASVAEHVRQLCLRREISPADASRMADGVEFEALRAHESRCLNGDAFRRIFERFVAYSILPPNDDWTEIGKASALFDVSMDKIWYCLSAIYSFSRGDDAASSAVGGAVGSQDFVRRSVKYWVHPQDLPFVVAQVIRHLPLSTAHDTYQPDSPGYVMGSPISSVYFDNTHFEMYHRRMRRLEGSSLYRVRWYGDETRLSDPGCEVFSELKVHHEAWSGEASTKRRFALANADVDAFLRGELPLSHMAAELSKQSSKQKEVNKFKKLAIDMLTMITVEDLRPALRTEYSRAAFQRGTDQSVRVSIDSNLWLKAEEFGASKHWCSTNLGHRHSVHLDFAVVEVKLQCSESERLPAWVEHLMKCRFMESVPKFSKYAHGVAALYGHSKYITLYPYWLHQMDVDFRAATKVDVDQFDSVRGIVAGPFQRGVDTLIFGNQPPQARRLDEYDSTRHLESRPWSTYHRLGHGSDISDSVARLISAKPLHIRHELYQLKQVWLSQRLSEASCCSDAVEPRPFGEIPGQTAKRIRVPQRYDPKTFLTGERYFLRWVESSVTLSLGGLAVIHFGDIGNLPIFGPFWAIRTHVTVGVIMMLLAISGLAYSLIQYHARSRRIYARLKIRFDDEVGPTVLTGALIFGMCVVAFTHVAERFGHMWF